MRRFSATPLRATMATGLTPAEAERVANSDGLVLSVESRFYSASVPAGRILSQAPATDSTVRRGWKIRVAEVEHDAVSVDVPEDVARVEKLLA